MNSQIVYRVLAAVPLGAASGRKIMSGIYRFLGEGYSWDVELVRSDGEFARMLESDNINKNDFNGMIVAFSEKENLRRRQATIDLPTVFVDYPDPTRSTLRRHAFVHDDEKSIASVAAQHLLSSGSRSSFAFVPSRTPTIWSDSRQAAFVAQMNAAQRAVSVFDGEGRDRDTLSQWLLSLPKPTSVLAAFDDRAIDVLEACRRTGLSVPDDVAVLGIGDDEPLCDAAVPPLSSVAIEFASQGYRAARELHALMLGGRTPRTDIRFGALETTVRSSTISGRRSAALAARALQFIKENALRGATTRDVVAHLHVSRRLATLRFREAFGQSILESILGHRLKEAKRLLSRTNLTVTDSAMRCGFNDSASFRATFKRHCGFSPRSFRTNGDSPRTNGDSPRIQVR